MPNIRADPVGLGMGLVFFAWLGQRMAVSE